MTKASSASLIKQKANEEHSMEALESCSTLQVPLPFLVTRFAVQGSGDRFFSDLLLSFFSSATCCLLQFL